MDQQRPLPEYSAVPPPSLSSECHSTDDLCLPEKFPLLRSADISPPFLFLVLLSFCASLTQQASRIPSHLQPKSSASLLRRRPRVDEASRKSEEEKKKIYENPILPPVEGVYNM